MHHGKKIQVGQTINSALCYNKSNTPNLQKKCGREQANVQLETGRINQF